MQFLEQAQLENQPTEVLYQLADKLKERRNKLYPEEKMMNEAASNSALGAEDDDMGLETDRKGDKSDIQFDLGSDKQLKHIGSSQVFDQNVAMNNQPTSGFNSGVETSPKKSPQ